MPAKLVVAVAVAVALIVNDQARHRWAEKQEEQEAEQEGQEAEQAEQEAEQGEQGQVKTKPRAVISYEQMCVYVMSVCLCI